MATNFQWKENIYVLLYVHIYQLTQMTHLLPITIIHLSVIIF